MAPMRVIQGTAARRRQDYEMLQRYVRLGSERDLGPLKDWSELIVANPVLGLAEYGG